MDLLGIAHDARVDGEVGLGLCPVLFERGGVERVLPEPFPADCEAQAVVEHAAAAPVVLRSRFRAVQLGAAGRQRHIEHRPPVQVGDGRRALLQPFQNRPDLLRGLFGVACWDEGPTHRRSQQLHLGRSTSVAHQYRGDRHQGFHDRAPGVGGGFRPFGLGVVEGVCPPGDRRRLAVHRLGQAAVGVESLASPGRCHELRAERIGQAEGREGLMEGRNPTRDDPPDDVGAVAPLPGLDLPDADVVALHAAAWASSHVSNQCADMLSFRQRAKAVKAYAQTAPLYLRSVEAIAEFLDAVRPRSMPPPPPGRWAAGRAPTPRCPARRPKPAAEHHAAVRRAVQSCPSGALSVIA